MAEKTWCIECTHPRTSHSKEGCVECPCKIKNMDKGKFEKL